MTMASDWNRPGTQVEALPRPAAQQEAARVLVVEPVELLASLWRSELDRQPDLECAAIASTREQALRVAGACDVALLGALLPETELLTLTRSLLAEWPGLKVVVTGLPPSRDTILRSVESGAAGYVLGEQDLQQALGVIRHAAGGRASVDPQVAPALVARLQELGHQTRTVSAVGERLSTLSPRERQVLELVAGGLTNAAVARRLGIALGTVKNHVHRILGKLQMKSRREAAAYLAAARRR